MADVSVRITRFEPLADGESYLLGFVAPTHAAFSAAVAAVRSLPPWQRAWIPDERLWWIAADGVSLLARNLPAIRPYIDEALRQAAEIHIEDAIGMPRPRVVFVPQEVRAAFHALALSTDAPASAVRAAFRNQVKTAHPDVGGSNGAMISLQSAYATALHWADRNRSESKAAAHRAAPETRRPNATSA